MGRPIPWKIGPIALGGPQLPGNAWGEIALPVPRAIQRGVGQVTDIQVRFDATVATHANDPAVPSYLLDRLLDMRLDGPNAFSLADHKGWHRAPREFFQRGKVSGIIAADLPATGGGGAGSYTRSFTKSYRMREPSMAHPMAFSMPSAFLAKHCKLRLFPFTTDQVVGGASLKLTGLTVTVYVYILDVDPKQAVIGAIRQEGYQSGVAMSPNPSPGAGVYMRLAALLDPATAVFGDDLSSFDHLDFGVQGHYTHYRRDVSEIARNFNSEYAADPRRHSDAPFTGQKEEFRFGDPLQNKSGLLHLVPLVFLHHGARITDAPAYLSETPKLRVNDDQLSGLPTQIDFIYDRIAQRPMDIVQAAIESVNPAAWQRFGGVQGNVAPEYTGVTDPSRVPLVVDLS